MNVSLHAAPAPNTAEAFPDDHAVPVASMPKRAPASMPKDSPAINAPKSSPAVLPMDRAATDTAIPFVNSNKTADTSASSVSPVHYRINLPPSAELRYEVSTSKKGISFHGQSTIHWQSDGSQYRLNGNTEIAEAGTRSFESEGAIDQFGIAPLLYTEKSGNKSATNTHFQRERNIISFSSSTANYPRQGGEQDRATIIWQLSGIGRGSPEKFISGTGIDIFVAGVRNGETWHIHVVDEEEVDLPTGKINAWHLRRTPTPGTYEPQLDIWLAPYQTWYPVKLRYTQTNGDTLDMSLSKVSSIPAY